MRTILLTLAVLLVFAAPASAQDKIGVINIRTLIAKSEPGQATKADLEEKFAPMKADIEQRKKDYEELVQEMEKQRLVLSQEAKIDKEMELKRKSRDLQEMVQLYQRKVRAAEEEASQPVFEILQDVIGEYGAANGYTAIIDRMQGGLLFVDDAADITNEVMVELNRAWREKQK
jgi:outer membrane protein